MFAEEFVVVDGSSPLWAAARPLLEAALQLEGQKDSYTWHGWRKTSIDTFLQHLPAHCTLLVGVWSDEGPELQEVMALGCVCEVKNGEVCSLRTFAALADDVLPSIEQLEPGYQHALALVRAARIQVAPVAWALFTDKSAWNELLFSEGRDGAALDKGVLLATLAGEGRCVLMGNQATYHSHSC